MHRRSLVAALACAAVVACVPALAPAATTPTPKIQLVVAGKAVTMTESQLQDAVFRLTPNRLASATIVVTVKGRQPVTGTAASYKRFLIQAREASAANQVRRMLMSVESFHADNTGTRGDVDGNAHTKGYAGMNVAFLRAHYDLAINARADSVVRATTESYCIEATIKGQSASKNGPTATIVPGHCPAR